MFTRIANTVKTNMDDLLKELAILKEKLTYEEKRKTNVFMEKVDAQENKKVAEKLVKTLMEEQTNLDDDRSKKDKLYDREMSDLKEKNAELMENKLKLQKECRAHLEDLLRLEREMQTENKLPQKNINFTGKLDNLEDIENIKDSPLDISSVCFVTINSPFMLTHKQALLTFEDEKVAHGIIKNKFHKINFGDDSSEVTALPVSLQQTLKYEVNINIAALKIRVCNLPAELTDEQVRDKVELAFYKSNIGGGEIENVKYDRGSNTAIITYRDYGVVQNVIKKRHHEIKGFPHIVTVEPCIDLQLKKLQIFSGICKRTVLFDGVNTSVDDKDEVQDAIQIHFQKPSNGGGEVDHVVCCMKARIVPHFEIDTQ